jgi:cytochrome P450
MTDTVTFDFTSPEMEGPGYWEALRQFQRRSPLTWAETNERFGGFWLATGYDVVLQMAQDWETFSSAEGVALGRPGPDILPYFVPLEVDPPRQRAYRKQVNPHLTSKVLAIHEEGIREVANDLIDTFVDRGSCNIATEFNRKFPGTIFFRLVIGSSEEEFRAMEPVARDITFADPKSEKWTQAINALRTWAGTALKSREESGIETDDVVNAICHLNDGGEAFVDYERSTGLQILIQGGIGTSASVLGVIMLVLCRDRELQERVRKDRDLVPRLVEECLRLEPPLPLEFRTVHRDVEIAGKQLRRGDKVGMSFGAANRDPSVFDHPDEVDLDRPHYRHLSFGAGVHRCIGSNLARLQIRVAVEQLVDRLSPFWLPDGIHIEYSSRQARGPISIPLEISPRT